MLICATRCAASIRNDATVSVLISLMSAKEVANPWSIASDKFALRLPSLEAAIDEIFDASFSAYLR